jgi:hypothetical protein
VSALPHDPLSPHDAAAACRNCGAAVPQTEPAARFCSQCGQETALHPPSVREFLHEFIGHYIALEGALWKTLALLVLQPGRLTREYLAGRRRRYVLPLRLYLTASFLFFVAAKLFPLWQNEVQPVGSPEARQAAAAAQQQAQGVARGELDLDVSSEEAPRAASSAASGASAPRVHHLRECALPGAHCGWVKRTLAPAAERWHDHPKEAAEHFTHLIASLAPYAVFLMLPVFAALTMLAYRSRRMLYGEHVVFSLHMHSFWFLALLVLALLPDAATEGVVLAMIAYGVWAMHNVYGGRWGPTLLRAAFVGLAYSTALLAGTLVLLVGALLAA